MITFLFAILGFLGGALCCFFALDRKRRSVENLKQSLDQRAIEVHESWNKFKAKQKSILESISSKEVQLEQKTREFENLSRFRQEELEVQYQNQLRHVTNLTSQLDERQRILDNAHVTYEHLRKENTVLKRDLRNTIVKCRKLEVDHHVLAERQETIDARSRELGEEYLKDTLKWVGYSLTSNNYSNCKQKIVAALEWNRKIGLLVSVDEESSYLAKLKDDYELVVRAALEREEQARIKARIREEELLARQSAKEIEQLERERAAIAAALERALADANLQHTAEVAKLQIRLAEAEEKAKRAISNAQLTKTGFVYVISNIGSFGKGVFKVGLTRRDEPRDRVRELSGAAVPFPYDVHMLATSDDAPALEYAIHRKLHKNRINKANPRKEFFRAEIEEIRQIVLDHQGKIIHTADAEALEYIQSQNMSDQDAETIEDIYDKYRDEESMDYDDLVDGN